MRYSVRCKSVWNVWSANDGEALKTGYIFKVVFIICSFQTTLTCDIISNGKDFYSPDFEIDINEKKKDIVHDHYDLQFQSINWKTSIQYYMFTEWQNRLMKDYQTSLDSLTLAWLWTGSWSLFSKAKWFLKSCTVTACEYLWPAILTLLCMQWTVSCQNGCYFMKIERG